MKRYWLLFSFLLLITSVHASHVDTVLVYSPSMKKNVKCCIVTPNSYKKGKERYPVVYLLHGYSGNHSEWVKRIYNAPAIAEMLGLILVCPDGGYNSWYFDSPVDSSYRYETFCTKELIEHVDKNYRTKADRKYRAISGLSMGGHGGLFLGFRHTDIYGQVGSTAGGVDIRPFPKYWDMTKWLGTPEEHPENWEKYTVINIADSVENGKQRIIIDCGKDDFFFPVNQALHKKLMERKIDHDYTERPGGHTKEYWIGAIPFQLLFFSEGFNTP